MGQAAIAAVAFIGGMVFAQVWPLLVRYLDSIKFRRVTQMVEGPGPSIQSIVHGKNTSDNTVLVAGSSPATSNNSHRRVGIAERRRMAELASLRAPTHQAAVTANNARAMETK